MKARAIDIVEIEKSYKDTKVLKGVTFQVRYGEIVALLGSNGAGKTTTLNIICGFLKQTKGSIQVAGHTHQFDLGIIRSKIGYVTQEMALYEKLSVKETVMFIGEYRGVEKSKLNEMKEYFWNIFDLAEIEDKKFKDLSSGQKQRAIIAAQLIHDPEILILDEVTASIDIVTSKKIMDFIKIEREKGKAILFSTHILSEAEYLSDRIIILDEGEVIEETTSSNLIKDYDSKNLFEAFFRSINEHKKVS